MRKTSSIFVSRVPWHEPRPEPVPSIGERNGSFSSEPDDGSPARKPVGTAVSRRLAVLRGGKVTEISAPPDMEYS